jgi:hypothetical protein
MPALQGNDADDSAKNGDACRQLLGRRLKPMLLKTEKQISAFEPRSTINAIHQRLRVRYLLGDADFADWDVVFLLPLLM